LGGRSIFPSERYHSSSRFSTWFSAPITFLKCGSTFVRSLCLNHGRVRHCLRPIGPLVSWTRLVNYLKQSY